MKMLKFPHCVRRARECSKSKFLRLCALEIAKIKQVQFWCELVFKESKNSVLNRQALFESTFYRKNSNHNEHRSDLFQDDHKNTDCVYTRKKNKYLIFRPSLRRSGKKKNNHHHEFLVFLGQGKSCLNFIDEHTTCQGIFQVTFISMKKQFDFFKNKFISG